MNPRTVHALSRTGVGVLDILATLYGIFATTDLVTVSTLGSVWIEPGRDSSTLGCRARGLSRDGLRCECRLWTQTGSKPCGGCWRPAMTQGGE